jgi:hypothetical protein
MASQKAMMVRLSQREGIRASKESNGTGKQRYGKAAAGGGSPSGLLNGP